MACVTSLPRAPLVYRPANFRTLLSGKMAPGCSTQSVPVGIWAGNLTGAQAFDTPWQAPKRAMSIVTLPNVNAANANTVTLFSNLYFFQAYMVVTAANGYALFGYSADCVF